MDEIKDIQKTDSVSRFIEQHNLRTNAFGENRAADRAYRRVERISIAVHLLTNHIDSEEPVRTASRTAAVGLLTDVLNIRDDMRSPTSVSMATLLGRVRYLISIVRLMVSSGFVSTPNGTTVVEALDDLGNFLVASQRSAISENVTLSKDDLVDVRMNYSPRVSTKSLKDMSDIKDVKDTSANRSEKDMSQNAHKTQSSESVRVQSILEVLRAGGSLGIKDIAANMPEYSEKMIQRELLDLVSRRLISKTGSKRWSRYALLA